MIHLASFLGWSARAKAGRLPLAVVARRTLGYELSQAGTSLWPGLPDRRLQLRHWFCLKYLSSLPCDPASGCLRLLAPGTIGGDARSGIHLSIQFGEQNECNTSPERRRTGRPLPDAAELVAAVSDCLSSLSAFVRAHRWMM